MQHIRNALRVARTAHDTAHVLDICVVQQWCVAVFRVFGSQPGRLHQAKRPLEHTAHMPNLHHLHHLDKDWLRYLHQLEIWQYWPRRLIDNASACATFRNPSACHDTLPEWSKGVDSSSTSASCVGSNPTGVSLLPARRSMIIPQLPSFAMSETTKCCLRGARNLNSNIHPAKIELATFSVLG